MADPAAAARLRTAMRAMIEMSLGVGPNGGPHVIPDDPQFRAGLAYAAHIQLHSVGRAHGMTDDRISNAAAGGRSCCLRTLIPSMEGVAAGLLTLAGDASVPGHVHVGMILDGRRQRT